MSNFLLLANRFLTEGSPPEQDLAALKIFPAYLWGKVGMIPNHARAFPDCADTFLPGCALMAFSQTGVRFRLLHIMTIERLAK